MGHGVLFTRLLSSAHFCNLDVSSTHNCSLMFGRHVYVYLTFYWMKSSFLTFDLSLSELNLCVNPHLSLPPRTSLFIKLKVLVTPFLHQLNFTLFLTVLRLQNCVIFWYNLRCSFMFEIPQIRSAFLQSSGFRMIWLKKRHAYAWLLISHVRLHS